MRTLRYIAILFAFFALPACNNVYEWNQKLTVVVQTPDGEVSGSSVTRVLYDRYWGISIAPDSSGITSKLSGEAVVVEVSAGKYLFVLLDGVKGLASSTLPYRYGTGDEFDAWARSIQNYRGTIEVSPGRYPMMVTFGNIDDPQSVRFVDYNNLAEVFGEGVELSAVSLSITDEPMTRGRVEGLLGWLSQISPNRLDGNRFERSDAANRAANSLSSGNFIKGVKSSANFE